MDPAYVHINTKTNQKLDKVNLDGAKSTINSNELNYEYLESILISMFSFLIFLWKLLKKSYKWSIIIKVFIIFKFYF